MKVFQRIQKKLAVMGFTPNQQKNNRGQWNFRQTCCVVVYSTGIISCGVNIFIGANNVQETAQSIYMLNGLAAIALGFISVILKNDKLFEVIEDLGKERNLSEY